MHVIEFAGLYKAEMNQGVGKSCCLGQAYSTLILGAQQCSQKATPQHVAVMLPGSTLPCSGNSSAQDSSTVPQHPHVVSYADMCTARLACGCTQGYGHCCARKCRAHIQFPNVIVVQVCGTC